MAKKHKKALAKSISWRLLSSATTFGITYAVLGSLQSAGLITLIEAVFKTILYYTHELYWQGKSRWFISRRREKAKVEVYDSKRLVAMGAEEAYMGSFESMKAAKNWSIKNRKLFEGKPIYKELHERSENA